MSDDEKIGKIYKLKNTINGKRYIGNTFSTLKYRMRKHKGKMKEGTSLICKKMRKYGIENYKMKLIEEYECNNRRELQKRTQYWINKLKPEYNKTKAYSTEKDKKEWAKKWREKNKEKYKKKIREWSKKYYYENKEKVKNKCKDYYKKNKKKFSKYAKKYYEKNIEKIKKYMREYRNSHQKTYKRKK